MNLRSKLLAAQLPLALGLGVLGLGSLHTVTAVGDSSQRILADNYRSVLAAQRMDNAAEQLDRVALNLVADRAQTEQDPAHDPKALFERELAIQQTNITEAGEAEATAALQAAWNKLIDSYTRLLATGELGVRGPLYFDRIEPALREVRRALDEIVALNQDAMNRKSIEAARIAQRMGSLLTVLLFAALGLGLSFSIWLTSRLLWPLDSLSVAAHRLGEEDLQARALVVGNDEIAAVAREFNAMAERVQTYRASTLGELLQAQQAAQAAIDSLPDPVVIFDVDDKVTLANDAAEAVLNLGSASSGQSPLSHTDPALRAMIDRAKSHTLGGKGPYVPRGFEEAVRVTFTAGDRFLLVRASPLYGEQGISGVTVLLQDVTRLRRFDELKNDLVSTVAHEFRTPLTSLHMAIHLCLEEAAGPLTDKQADLLAVARQDCERLQAIVNDLLDLARLQAGKIQLKRESLSASILVETAIDGQQHQARQKSITMESDIEPSLPAVLADRERIQLVFANLLANAVRHTPPNGTVTVRARQDENRVRFEVTDTGPGIAPEFHERIFERFFRVPGTPGGGAGLGLAVAKEVVEGHGGTIGVASEPGRGATFWFSLPTD